MFKSWILSVITFVNSLVTHCDVAQPDNLGDYTMDLQAHEPWRFNSDVQITCILTSCANKPKTPYSYCSFSKQYSHIRKDPIAFYMELKDDGTGRCTFSIGGDPALTQIHIDDFCAEH